MHKLSKHLSKSTLNISTQEKNVITSPKTPWRKVFIKICE